MRKVLILILLVTCILIYPVHSLTLQDYAKAKNNDTGIYQYFSKLLKYSDDCLKSVADEKPDVKLSTSLNKVVETTWKECLMYSSRGVKSNVSYVIDPFLNLSRAIKDLSLGQLEFLKNQNNSTYLALQGLTKMRAAIPVINDSINEINNTTIWNGTSSVHFTTAPLKKDVKRIMYLIKAYNLTVYKIPAIRNGFFISVSNTHPFLYEKIFVYIYTSNTKPLYVVVNPTSGPMKRISLSAKTKYVTLTFNSTGVYKIHAEGSRNGDIIKSNTISVYVTKIPANILLSANTSVLINQRVKVLGFLSDYYGKPINSSVYVYIGNNSTIFSTNKGYFSFNVTRNTEGYLNITAIYRGSKIYRSASTKLSLFFSRLPVFIHITPDKTNVNVNGTVHFTGNLKGFKGLGKLKIFVNSSCINTINASKNFSFYVTFKKAGKYSVYVYFSGNSTYSPAKSNVVYITVGKKPVNIYPLLASISVLVAFIAGYYIYRSRKQRKPKKKVEEKPEMQAQTQAQTQKTEKTVKREKAVSSFQQMFSALVSKYNLKKGLTPRELYEHLKDEKFSAQLKKVINIHEKLMYGEEKLSEEEFKLYNHLISEIMEEIK